MLIDPGVGSVPGTAAAAAEAGAGELPGAVFAAVPGAVQQPVEPGAGGRADAADRAGVGDRAGRFER